MIINKFIPFRHIGYLLSVAISFTFFFTWVDISFASNFTWDGGGSTNNWSDAANWSSDSVPVTNDNVIFNGTSTKNVTIDSSITVLGISINSGYTGIITQGVGKTITITSFGFTQNEPGSTFTGGNSPITIQGIVTLTSGIFTSTSNTLSLESHFMVPGATFNHNSGTVSFTGSGNSNFDVNNNINLNNLFINRSTNRYVNILDTITVSGNLELKSGITYNGTLDVDGNVSVLSAFEGGNSTLLLNSAISNSNVHLQNGSKMIGLKMMSPQATLTTDSGANVTFTGNIELNNGTITLSNGITNIEQHLTITGGSFNPGSGTITFNGTGNSILSIPPNLSLYNFIVNKPSTRLIVIANNSTITVNGNLELNGGSVIGGILDANGGVSVSGIFEGGNSTLQLDNPLTPSNLNLQNGSQMIGLKVNSPLASITADPSANVSFEGNVDLNNGSFTLSSGTSSFEQNFTITGGTFNHNSGTFVLNGPGSAYFNANVPLTLNNFYVSKPSGRFVQIGSINPVTVDGSLQLNGGSVLAGTIDANGAMTVSTSFEGGTGLLLIDNISSTQNLHLANNSQMMGITVKSALASVTMSPGSNVTFEGNVELNSGTISLSSGTTHLEQNLTITGGTFNHNSGTLSFDNNGASYISLNSSLDLNNLTINKSIPRFVQITPGYSLVVHGDLQVNGGPVYFGNIDVYGNASFGSGFTGGTTNFSFIGGNNQTYSNQTGVFFTPNVTVNKSGNSTLSLSSNLNLTNANQNFNILGGIVDMGSNNLNINGTITVTGKLIQHTGNITTKGVNISLNSEWENRSTGDITLGTTGVLNDGLIDFDGGINGCQTNNEILIRSSSPGTSMPWTGLGTFWLNDLDMQDQRALVALTAYHSTNTGNNLGLWNFHSGCASIPNPTEVTPITSPSNDTTPNYTFHTIRPGGVSFTGNPDCISFSIPSNGVSSGNNTFTFNTLSEGLHTCQLIITDDNGNTGNLPLSPFVIDTTTLPLQTVSISTSNMNPLFAKTGDTIRLSFEANEAINTPSVTIFGNTISASIVSGNMWMILYTLTGTENEGIIPFQISYQDLLGNSVTQTSSTTDGSQITYDKTPPALTEITPIGNSYISNPQYSFSYYDLTDSFPISYMGDCESFAFSLSNGNKTLSLTGVGITTLPDGTYGNCQIMASDFAGNTSTLDISTFTVNTQAPILSEVNPIGSVQISTSFPYSFTSDQSGTFSLTGSCISTTNTVNIGTNTITFDAILATGTISNCVLTVTNIGLISSSLNITPFQVISSQNNGGSGGGGGGGSADNNTKPKPTGKTLGDSSPASIEEEPFFLDTENHWARPLAFDLSDAGIINKEKYLRINDITTQAETLKIAMRSANIPLQNSESTSYYPNISDDDWVKNYANTAYDLDILKILPGNTYEKDAGITREDALLIFMKAFHIAPDSILESGFIDIEDTILESYVAKAKAMGLVNGTTSKTFEPYRFMTRAEMVKFASMFRHSIERIES